MKSSPLASMLTLLWVTLAALTAGCEPSTAQNGTSARGSKNAVAERPQAAEESESQTEKPSREVASAGAESTQPVSGADSTNALEQSPDSGAAEEGSKGESEPVVRRPNLEELEGPAEEAPRARPRFRRPGQPEDITFDDLKLDMEADTVFDPSMLTERAKQLEGQKVRLRGFIFPGVFQQTGLTRFPLLRNTQCKFGPGGPAYHIVIVDLKEGVTADFTTRPVTVEGVLTVDPFQGPDGNTWAVFHLAGEKVED